MTINKNSILRTLETLSNFEPTTSTSKVVLYRVRKEGEEYLRAKPINQLSLTQRVRLFFKTNEFRLYTVQNLATTSLVHLDDAMKGEWFKPFREKIITTAKDLEKKLQEKQKKTYKDTLFSIYTAIKKIFIRPSCSHVEPTSLLPSKSISETAQLQEVPPISLRGIYNQGNWCYLDALVKGMCVSSGLRTLLKKRLEEIPKRQKMLLQEIEQLHALETNDTIKEIEQNIENKKQQYEIEKNKIAPEKNRLKNELTKLSPLLKGRSSCAEALNILYCAKDRGKEIPESAITTLKELQKKPEIIDLEKALGSLEEKERLLTREKEHSIDAYKQQLSQNSPLLSNFDGCKTAINFRKTEQDDLNKGIICNKALLNLFEVIESKSDKKPLETTDLEPFVQSLKDSFFIHEIRSHEQQDSRELLTAITTIIWGNGFFSYKELTHRNEITMSTPSGTEDNNSCSNEEPPPVEALYMEKFDSKSLSTINPSAFLFIDVPEDQHTIKLYNAFWIGLLDAYEVNKEKETLMNKEANAHFFEGEDGLQKRLNFLGKYQENIPIVRNIILREPTPEVLPIVIKRFNSDNSKRSLESEIPFFMTVPTDGYDKPASYVLRSVVIHSGSTSKSGHYYTYTPDLQSIDATTGQPKIWIRQDDSRVYQESSETALKEIKKDGYILFYDKFDKI